MLAGLLRGARRKGSRLFHPVYKTSDYYESFLETPYIQVKLPFSYI
jgi:hypothetical protein